VPPGSVRYVLTVSKVFLGCNYKMSKCRVIGAGAGLGRANGGGGFNTAGHQGGGDKKQGLISTKNMRVRLVPYVRTRADGGSARHWVYCMNQLGGVGRKWGQAAGPGNRGGIHQSCKLIAKESRRDNPRRLQQSSGHGPTTIFRANAPRYTEPPAPSPIEEPEKEPLYDVSHH